MPLSIPKHGTPENTFPLKSNAFHHALGGKVLGIGEGNDPFTWVAGEEVIYQEPDRFFGIAFTPCAGYRYPKAYLKTRCIGIWIGHSSVAHETDDLLSIKSFHKQQSRFALDQARLLIRLTEQREMV